MKARYPLATRLYVYGELCGGIYEHPRASAGVLPLKSFFGGLGRDVQGGTFRFSGGNCAIPYYHSESCVVSFMERFSELFLGHFA